MENKQMVETLMNAINILDKLGVVGVQNAANVVNVYNCVTAVKNSLEQREATVKKDDKNAVSES